MPLPHRLSTVLLMPAKVKNFPFFGSSVAHAQRTFEGGPRMKRKAHSLPSIYGCELSIIRCTSHCSSSFHLAQSEFISCPCPVGNTTTVSCLRRFDSLLYLTGLSHYSRRLGARTSTAKKRSNEQFVLTLDESCSPMSKCGSREACRRHWGSVSLFIFSRFDPYLSLCRVLSVSLPISTRCYDQRPLIDATRRREAAAAKSQT